MVRVNNSFFNDLQPWSTNEHKRTKEDFVTFCNIVLQYTQYEALRQEVIVLSSLFQYN